MITNANIDSNDITVYFVYSQIQYPITANNTNINNVINVDLMFILYDLIVS